MVTLTDGAAAAIKQLAALSEDPHSAGLRVSTGTSLEETVALDFAASPEPGDHVFEVRGSRIFLSPSAADLLEGLALDYEVCAGRPMFSIVVRARVPEEFDLSHCRSADSATLDDLEEDLMADDPALAAGFAILKDLADGPPPQEPGS